jgi:hypothetical protein
MKEKKIIMLPPIDFMEERRIAEINKPRVNAKKRKKINKIYKRKKYE